MNRTSDGTIGHLATAPAGSRAEDPDLTIRSREASLGDMDSTFNAFEASPVPPPGPDAAAPEPFRGIYGMPSFVTIPTTDLAASVRFWTSALDFFELFGIPDRLAHLRRWAFQDVLLVPTTSAPTHVGAMSISFACVLNQIDTLVESCRAADASSVSEPRDTPWNTRDIEIITPEKVRVVFTAAKPHEPASPEAKNLSDVGIRAPGPDPASAGRDRQQ